MHGGSRSHDSGQIQNQIEVKSYYGDEIGMSGSLDELNITDIKDPFAMANCDPDDIECYQSKSRDTMRTPMQVGSINIYLISK